MFIQFVGTVPPQSHHHRTLLIQAYQHFAAFFFPDANINRRRTVRAARPSVFTVARMDGSGRTFIRSVRQHGTLCIGHTNSIDTDSKGKCMLVSGNVWCNDNSHILSILNYGHRIRCIDFDNFNVFIAFYYKTYKFPYK